MSDEALDFGWRWQRRADRWAGLAATAPTPDDPHLATARLVFASAITPTLRARIMPGGHGACLIADSRSLGTATGLRAAVWRTAPGAFRTDTGWVAPWPVTLEIVSAVGRAAADRIARLVGTESKAQHLCCLHGNAVVHAGEFRTRMCCKCEFGVRKGPAMPHDATFLCPQCDAEHPGSRLLDGCPQWWVPWGRLPWPPRHGDNSDSADGAANGNA